MLVPLGRNNFSMFFSIMSLVQTSASLALSSVWCRDTNHLMSRAMRWLDESGEKEDSEDFSSVLEDSEVLDESPSWSSEQSDVYIITKKKKYSLKDYVFDIGSMKHHRNFNDIYRIDQLHESYDIFFVLNKF